MPEQIKNLSQLNNLLAHKPWVIQECHIKETKMNIELLCISVLILTTVQRFATIISRLTTKSLLIMRKFFTFVILALAAVSVWGTEYQIGMGGTTGTTQNAPFSNRSATYISQLIYTKAELQGAGMVSGDLSAISFWSTATTAYTRNVAIYIAHTSYSSFSTSTEKLVNGTQIILMFLFMD